jgi:hypothetical protein
MPARSGKSNREWRPTICDSEALEKALGLLVVGGGIAFARLIRMNGASSARIFRHNRFDVPGEEL